MSHSYQHSQPQQRRLLSQFLHHNQLHQQFFNIITPQTSLSPSTATSTTTTTTTTSFSFFHNKHYQDEDEDQDQPPFPCCFNILSNSKRFKFHVSNMDHHLQLDHFSSFKSPSQNIVSLLFLTWHCKNEVERISAFSLKRLFNPLSFCFCLQGKKKSIGLQKREELEREVFGFMRAYLLDRYFYGKFLNNSLLHDESSSSIFLPIL